MEDENSAQEESNGIPAMAEDFESVAAAEDAQMQSAEGAEEGAAPVESAVAAAAEPAAAAAKAENLQVLLRLRPLSKTEEKAGDSKCILALNETTVETVAPESCHAYRAGERRGTFTFNRVFDDNVGQEQLFRDTLSPMVEAALEQGKNALTMSYGEFAVQCTQSVRLCSCVPASDCPSLLCPFLQV